MKKRIISLTIILIIFFTNYAFAATAFFNNKGGVKLNTIATKDKNDVKNSVDAKYSANTVGATHQNIDVYEYNNLNKKITLNATGKNGKRNIAGRVSGEKEYVEYFIEIPKEKYDTRNTGKNGEATIIYKNAVNYLGNSYHIKLNIKRIVKTNSGKNTNTVTVRIGAKKYNKNEETYNAASYTEKVTPMIGLTKDGTGDDVQVTIDYYIVDNNYNPVDISGVFAITDIDENQGIYLQNFVSNSKNTFMKNKTNNYLMCDNNRVGGDNSKPGTYIYSTTTSNINDGSADVYTLQNLIKNNSENNHIHAVLTWKEHSAYSSLFFTGNEVKRKLKVSFTNTGSISIPSQEVISGENATRPTDPQIAGYDFKGWSRTGKNNNDFTKITEDTVFKANWEYHKYNLKYILNGGTRHTNNVDRTFTINDTINFDIPTRAGFTFDGWYTNKELTGNKVDSIGINTTHDVTVYAKWIPNNTAYTIMHYVQLDGNTYYLKKIENKTGTTGSNVEAMSEIFTGYKYNAEVSAKTKTGVIAADGSLVLKLYYDKETYTINYDTKGGINDSSNPTSYTIGSNINFKAPTRDGYEFKGWYLDSQYNTLKNSINTSDTGNIIVYAKWEEKPVTRGSAAYKVEHYFENANGIYNRRDELTDTSTGTIGSSVNATPKAIAGYTENVNYANRIANGTITADGNLVLKLYYNRNEYNIVYETNGGTNNADNPSKYKTGDVITFKSPTKEGYKFAGWYEDSEFKTLKYKIENETGDKKVFAKWIIKTDIPYKVEHYKETLNGKYELAVTDELKDEYNKNVEAVAKNFEGYNENKEHNERVASGVVKLDGSLVLKLYYNKKKYTVTFNTDGGTPVPESQTVEYEGKASKPNDPEKIGYTFSGWYDKNGQKYIFGSLVSSDIELTAKWVKIENNDNNQPNKEEKNEDTNKNAEEQNVTKATENVNEQNNVDTNKQDVEQKKTNATIKTQEQSKTNTNNASANQEKTETSKTVAKENSNSAKPNSLPKTGIQISLIILGLITLIPTAVFGAKYFKINRMMK